jgi:hypothetical protein
LPAANLNGKVMNAKTKTYKCSNLANWEREVMQMRTMCVSRASKPPDASTEMGIPRG